MAHPLLVIKPDQAEGFIQQMKKTTFYKEKTVKAKAKKAKKKPVAKKKKVKVKPPKVVIPPRPSPLAKGDEVWVQRGGVYVKTKITRCLKPVQSERTWTYEVASGMGVLIEEDKFIPAKILTLMANDANKMRIPDFAAQLNEVFGAEAMILAVYRSGQKRPWAYYVIPDPTRIWKKVEWKITQYGSQYNKEANILVRPVKEMTDTFIPVSSAPQEILTYLGNRIYNRTWMKENKSDHEL